MKATTIILAVLMTLVVLAGCAPRGEIALRDANPDAYDATRGGHSPGGFGGNDSDNDSDNGDE